MFASAVSKPSPRLGYLSTNHKSGSRLAPPLGLQLANQGERLTALFPRRPCGLRLPVYSSASRWLLRRQLRVRGRCYPRFS